MIKDRDTTVGYHCPFCGMSILHNINIFSMNGNLMKLKCVCGASELIVYAMKDHKYRITVPCILCPNSHSFTLSSGTFFQKDLFPFTCKFTAINICFIGKYGKVHEAMKRNEEELMKTFAAYEEEYGEGGAGDPDGSLLLDDGDEYYGKGEKSLFNYFNDLDDDDDDGYLYDDDDDDLTQDWYDDDPDYIDDLEDPIDEEPDFILYRNKNYKPDSEGSDSSDEVVWVDNLSEQRSKNEQNAFKVSSYPVVLRILDILSELYTEKKIFCKCGKFVGKIVILENAVRIGCKNCGSERDIRSATASDAEYMGNLDELYLDYDD